VGDRRDPHDRQLPRRPVEPGELAEGALEPPLLELDLALDHDLGVGGRLGVHAHTADHPHRRAEERAGHGQLVGVARQAELGGDQQRGMDAECDRHRQGPPRPLRREEVLEHVGGRHVDAEQVRAVELVALDAGVADAGDGVAGHVQAGGDIWSAVQLGQRGDRQLAQVGRARHHLLARGVLDPLGGDRVVDRREHVVDGVPHRGPERERQLVARVAEVADDREAAAANLLEDDDALAQRRVLLELAADRRQLEDPVDLGLAVEQPARPLEAGQQAAEVLPSTVHAITPAGRR
jgi:hypothetical protein